MSKKEKKQNIRKAPGPASTNYKTNPSEEKKNKKNWKASWSLRWEGTRSSSTEEGIKRE